MKKLHFLFLLMGALMIVGCPLDLGEREDLGGGEGPEGTAQAALTVAASPSLGGTIIRSPNSGQYEPGTVVTLRACPAYGYLFTRWEGDATGSENPTTITMDRGKATTAVFTWSGLSVMASPPSGGTVTQSPGLPRYEPGTVVTLTAKPASGYVFVRWEGDVTGSTSPMTITMDGGKTVTAIFAPTGPRYTLTVTASPSEKGTVTRSPDQIDYESGAVVELTANPSLSGYQIRWQGDATGWANPTTITMNGNKTVTAVFDARSPLIQLSTSSLTFSAIFGGAPPSDKTVDITNGGTSTLRLLELSFPDGKPAWLSATLSGSSAPATLTVGVSMSDPNAFYSATCTTRIAITSPVAGNSQFIKVILNLSSPPQPVPAPAPYTPYFPGGGRYAPPNKVICAELHRQGLMDETIFEADEAFGMYLRVNHKDVLLGYQLWAKPVVKWMQKSKTVTKIVAFVATPWSYEMAYRMGARDKGSFAGRILMDIGVPVCRAIGWAAIWAGHEEHLKKGVQREVEDGASKGT